MKKYQIQRKVFVLEERLTLDYEANVAKLDALLRVKENFDVIKKPLTVGNDELTFYYIDGFIKDVVMGKLMLYQVIPFSQDLVQQGSGHCPKAMRRHFVSSYPHTPQRDH